MNKISFTSQSIHDLEEIHDYIAKQNPQNALHFINFIEEKCYTLLSTPGIGVIRDDLAPNLRSYPVKN